MIRARTQDGTVILGITAENVTRLKDGRPILVDLLQLGGAERVVILYGETMTDLIRQLERDVGPLPTPQPLGPGGVH